MHRLFLIVGPSGSGKTTLAQNLARQGVPEIVSHTTRPQRAGEEHAVSYHFVTDGEFDEMVARGSMLEHVRYGSHQYGVSRFAVTRALEEGSACLVVEAGGARQIKEQLGDRCRILFLSPPDLPELWRRMVNRGDAPADIDARLATFDDEIDAATGIVDHVLPPASEQAIAALALRLVDGKPPIRFVYVAGAYSAPTEERVRANVNAALDAGDLLEDAGLRAFVPHLSHYRHLRRPRDYEHWMSIDFDWITRCDALLRLPSQSSGGDREVEFATRYGMPVFYDVEHVLAAARA